MRDVLIELEQVRRQAVRLALLRRVSNWLAVLLALSMGLGVLDFLLRLPGWLRLGMVVLLAAGALAWLRGRWRAISTARLPLPVLALRAERLHPPLAGQLASAVEFEMSPRQWSGDTPAGALAQQTIARTNARIAQVNLRDLLNPAPTWRALGELAAVALLLLLLATTLPEPMKLAALRWLLPLGSTQWPRRVELAPQRAPAVWPSDTPVELHTDVVRGRRASLRTWLHWRLRDEQGHTTDWQAELMNEQSQHGSYEGLLDTPGALASFGATGATLEYWFEAGDDRTEPATLRLSPRPALTQLLLTLTPPAYAQGLIATQTLDLAQTPLGASQLAAATALRGSSVEWALHLSKPIPFEAANLAALLPGLPTDLAVEATPSSGVTNHLTLRFLLEQDVQTPVTLRDRDGLQSLSERQYRLEATEDRPPVVSIAQPPADEAVLATAVLPVEVVAQDDIAVAHLELTAQPHRAGNSATEETASSSLAQQVGRATHLLLTHQLDLASWELKPGDELVLRGLTRDGFVLGAATHEPVLSAPRRLRVIDAPTLVGQVRNELATIRQQAIRLHHQQQEVTQQPGAQQAGEQQQIAQRIAAQREVVSRLNQRMTLNRLDEPQLQQLLERAGQLLEQSEAAARDASQALQQAQKQPTRAAVKQQEAKQQQAAAQQALTDLIALLDQGRDALTLQLQLQQLRSAQDGLAQQARELLPRTLGKTPEQLEAALRQQLAELARQQEGLSQQAQQMLQQLQQTAEALQQQSNDLRDEAAAQALKEAAATGQREGLTQKMQQAARSSERNQLADAGQQQQQALQTLDQMSAALGETQSRQQAILKRRLEQLAQVIERLLTQQRRELERLAAATELPALEEPQEQLRRNTLSAAEGAKAEPTTREVGDVLDRAVNEQSQAVLALRNAQAQGAQQAETAAAGELQRALEQVQQMQQRQQEKEQQAQREELRQRYLALAQRQAQLREQTTPLTELAQLDRRQRRTAMELGNQEADVQSAARELGADPQVARTIIFRVLHQRIDDQTRRIAGDLRQASVNTAVLRQQQGVERLLQQMASVLAKPQQEKDPFQEPGQGNQGGSGGSGQQKPPLIPPAAELRLLRLMQEGLLAETRALHESPPAQRSELVVDLSVRQRELAGLSEQLMEQVTQAQQRQQQQARPAGKPEGDAQP